MMLSALENHIAGRPAAVCGGGPSLTGDLALVLERWDAEVIAVKQHALYFQHELGFSADWICFLEDPDKPAQAELRTALRLSPEVVKVAPFERWSDVELDVPWWNGGFSSSLAVWLACWMGAAPVLLCGMDCYQGGDKYAYDRPGYSHPCFDFPVESHVVAWLPAFQKCEKPGVIRAVSGPLVEVFGRWLP